MGWWIALGIIVLLAIIPIGVLVNYDEDGPLVKVVAGFIRITVFPMKKKEKKPGKQKKSKKTTHSQPSETGEPAEQPPAPVNTKPEKPKKEKLPKEKKGGSLLDFLPLVEVALNMLGELFGRTLHVDVLEVNLVMAGDDPCDLATNYGRAWAALGNLWPRLEEMLTIKKRDVRIQCDFTSNETLISARLQLTITLGRLISLLVRYGFRALKEFLKIRKKRKGGAVK